MFHFLYLWIHSIDIFLNFQEFWEDNVCQFQFLDYDYQISISLTIVYAVYFLLNLVELIYFDLF